MEFPRLAYKVGGPWDLECGKFAVQEVASPEALEALGPEWHLTQEAAKDAHDNPPAPPVPPPTREEMEAQAKALGVDFKPQWGDKKLAEAIAAAMAEATKA